MQQVFDYPDERIARAKAEPIHLVPIRPERPPHHLSQLILPSRQIALTRSPRVLMPHSRVSARPFYQMNSLNLNHTTPIMALLSSLTTKPEKSEPS
ncbi:hypothetical protein [Rubritalea tangerina]|uniref:hypothetical protein n=1 Tax=Rubritalea tangerina TaxID=430798 RepID=UPI0036224214